MSILQSAESKRRGAIVLLLLAISGAAFYFGIQLRREEWFRTESVRFRSDVFNGFRWGRAANAYGLVNVYDLDYEQRIPGVQRIDYTPLRLTIVWLWARWAAVHFPQVTVWENDYELTRWMLRVNLVAEFASSVLVFLLIRMWIIRMDNADRPPQTPPKPFRGVVRAMIGALMFWFNPVVIRSAQMYPQWDVWNMPFFLGAVLFACVDWWFAAGFCFVIGAFLKGQILLLTPMFLLWPVFQLRFDALLRFISGSLSVAALIAIPWLLATPTAMTWFMMMLIGMAMTMPLTMRLRLNWQWIAVALIGAVVICWPWTSKAGVSMRILAPTVLGIVALSRFLPSRLLPHIYSMAVAVAVFLMIPLYGASAHWFTEGFEYGAQKIMQTAIPGTFNLPSVMVSYYGWPNDPNFDVQLPLIGAQASFRHLMLGVYGICLVLCTAGAVMHFRRNDSRFLVAIIAPWLCFYVILTQMNNRYLMWAAGFSSLLVGVDLGMTLLGCVVIVIGSIAIAQQMNLHLSLGTPDDIRMFQALTPHLAWPLMLAAAVYLYVAVKPRSRSLPR